MEYFLFEVTTGRRIVPLDVEADSWSDPLNAVPTIEATVPLDVMEAELLELRTTGAPIRSALGVERDGFVLAGPITSVEYDRDGGTATLSARGIERVLDDRNVLPPLAYTIPVSQWVLPDPENPAGTIPNPALATTLAGLDHGSIMRALVAQAMSVPGGALPIDLQAPRGGFRQQTYKGVDFKSVASAISDLRTQEGGADATFVARIVDGAQVRWTLETGTEDAPRLASPIAQRVDVSTGQEGVSGLKIELDGSSVASVVWATGGRTDAVPLTSRQSSTALTDAGYPLTEADAGAYNSVSVQSTLDAHARSRLALGRGATEVWSFDLLIDEAPAFGDYRPGDFFDVTIEGDALLADGTRRMRVLERSYSSSSPEWVSLKLAEGRSVDG